MRMAFYEQQTNISQQQSQPQQSNVVQFQSAMATATTETFCADMQIPTITSTVMASPMAMPSQQTTGEYYEVFTTNGQPIIDVSTPVYLVSSNEPLTVEVSSSDDTVNFMTAQNHHVSAIQR